MSTDLPQARWRELPDSLQILSTRVVDDVLEEVTARVPYTDHVLYLRMDVIEE